MIREARPPHAPSGRHTASGIAPGTVPRAQQTSLKRLARKKSPKTRETRSLREIAAELAVLGHVGPGGKPYEAMSIKRMLER